ncbi:MAG: caspase family protein [Saprospiraceae bacterium]
MTRLLIMAVVCLPNISTLAATPPTSFFPVPFVDETGCTKGNCFNGYGTYVYANGSRYIGYFSNGDAHGEGILYFSNGNKYLGDWQHNFREGQGKFIFVEGHEYTGGFHRNQFQGKGLMKYANGDRYEGDWAHNQPNGFGKYTFHTGDRYEGQFRGGKFNGEGTMFYKNGARFSGHWMNNKKNGRGTFYDANGRSTAGEWVLGQPLDSPPPVATDGEALRVEVSEDTPPAAAPDAGKTAPVTAGPVRIWAVVVGVATYPHMPSLRFTDDDAYQFYAFLKSPEGGALPDNQVKVLVDDNATRDNILENMRTTFAQADENDVVLFYFSGHGIEGAFVPEDFDGVNYRLYHEDIRQILENSRAKYKLVVGDACHSGSLFGMAGDENLVAARSTTDDMLDRYYKAFESADGGTALLMSSKGGEVSLEDSGLRSGVFSYYLIKGLKGEADRDGDKIVTIGELYSYVTDKVSRYTAGAQTPTITGHYDKRMPVSAVRE